MGVVELKPELVEKSLQQVIRDLPENQREFAFEVISGFIISILRDVAAELGLDFNQLLEEVNNGNQER